MTSTKPGSRAKTPALNELKKLLSKEILEDTVTAADKAYREFGVTERIAQIEKLERFIEITESENAELKSSFEKERCSNEEKIAPLREKVNKNCEQVARLTCENRRLMKEKEASLISYSKQLATNSNNFKRTQEKLASEIKLLNDKLANLEEFRQQRANLVERNNRTQSHLKVVQERTAGIVNVYKRLDLINKDRIAQELKENLLKLSIQLQESSSTGATKSLVRENIAINNELSAQVGSWQALWDENRELKKQKRELLSTAKDEEKQTENCLRANVLQTQIIDRLVHELEKTDGYYEEMQNLESLLGGLEKELERASCRVRATDEQMRRLLQNKHAVQTKVNELTKECNSIESTNHEELVNLRTALLHVADAQFLRLRFARKRIPEEEVDKKLTEILKSLNNMFPCYPDKQDSAELRLGSYVSQITYDPEKIFEPAYNDTLAERDSRKISKSLTIDSSAQGYIEKNLDGGKSFTAHDAEALPRVTKRWKGAGAYLLERHGAGDFLSEHRNTDGLMCSGPRTKRTNVASAKRAGMSLMAPKHSSARLRALQSVCENTISISEDQWCKPAVRRKRKCV
ncbi:unnamed protein product [Nesidiocoris tenuis]|uniref:Cilia- and flagella-associated protein 157 n=1 Tax=Nesidiocoris tenuis TaxID=355587 RepID=A0A6H5HHA8_9HEMI|nr:unnamed protein product [Nesidiocoris tenuis]